MNLLACVGANYRDFKPLNSYAQNFAHHCFGRVHQMFFFDSCLKNCNTCEILEANFKYATQALIFAEKESFGLFLKNVFQEESEVVEMNPNVLRIIARKWQKELVVWMVDLQNILQHQGTQELENLQESIALNHKDFPLYLYPLGFDAKSAQTLLQGTARDCNVDLKVLKTDSSLEVLCAFGGDLKNFQEMVNGMFPNNIFSTFNLAQSIIALLKENHYKITSAESCTGGLIAYYLTQQSGASAVFDGGVISYANSIKEKWLGVKERNLLDFGAVSEAVVRDMLDGALRLSGADFALATSGIAGPTGGTPNKPVGIVYIGVKEANGMEVIERLQFSGNRIYIQEQATLYAYLLFLRVFLRNY